MKLQKKAGAALVVTLCILVLLTVLVLAYFDRALLHRKISFSSAGQARAQTVALTAMATITGDLRAEMLSGSVTNLVSGVMVFSPSSNRTLLPARMGTVAEMTNLIKWSGGGSNFWAAAPGYSFAGPVRAAAGNSTVTPSANGRFIDVSRWGLPQFGTNFSTTNTPSWILVTREGPLTNAATAAADLAKFENHSATNSRHVIGRFAYTIYDVGGLVDATVAGYPAGTSLNHTALKGGEGYADLEQVGLSSAQIDTLVNWRNAGSITNYAGHLKNFGPEHGFLRAAPGDQGFVGRQDFIDFWKSKMGADTSLLKSFTTFSREANAPSFSPLQNAQGLGGSNDGFDMTSGANLSNLYAYKDKANDAASVNRFFPNVRVKEAFTRLNGKPAKVGEPLIKSRFDLSKLSWIRHDGVLPDNVTVDDVYNHFGLRRNVAGQWVYDHGAANRILTLEEVALANREPDFFELLQAGILKGSLGLVSGNPQNQTNENEGGEFYRLSTMSWRFPLIRSDKDGRLVYAHEKYQIMQIGANMIDQADADSFPTTILFNDEPFYGVENLPYINALADTALRPPPGGAIAPNDYQAYVHRWLTASLWNPHQNALASNAAGPQKFRIFIGQGEGVPKVWGLPVAGPASNSARVFRRSAIGGSVYGPNTAGPAWIGFNLADYPGKFSEPTSIDYDKSFTNDPSGGPNLNDSAGRIQTALGWKRAGIYMGWSFSPEHVKKVSACAPLAAVSPLPTSKPGYCAAVFTWVVPLTVELQYQDPAGEWRTYHLLRGVIPTRDGRGDAYMEPKDPEWAKWEGDALTISSRGPLTDDQDAWVIALLDPRSPRLNMPSRIGLRSAQNYLSAAIDTSAPVGPSFPKSPKLWSNWVNNNATSAPSYYTDRDSVRRSGDAAGWTGADPQVAASSAQRPLVLDRPFQSVGEIGYVFRDDPWKTLNLFSTNSADSGLLDLFCIGAADPDESKAVPEVVAGKVDLNTASEATLKALLSKVARTFDPANPQAVATSLTSTSDIQALAQSITNRIQTKGPFLSVSELAEVFPQDTTFTTRNPGNKAQREALIRALTGSVQTRTWNLMVDVIAQSGKFKPQSTTLNDFVVEGEKRYWLHIAIDRFTGEVVDQNLEPVFEW